MLKKILQLSLLVLSFAVGEALAGECEQTCGDNYVVEQKVCEKEFEANKEGDWHGAAKVEKKCKSAAYHRHHNCQKRCKAAH